MGPTLHLAVYARPLKQTAIFRSTIVSAQYTVLVVPQWLQLCLVCLCINSHSWRFPANLVILHVVSSSLSSPAKSRVIPGLQFCKNPISSNPPRFPSTSGTNVVRIKIGYLYPSAYRVKTPTLQVMSNIIFYVFSVYLVWLNNSGFLTRRCQGSLLCTRY